MVLVIATLGQSAQGGDHQNHGPLLGIVPHPTTGSDPGTGFSRRRPCLGTRGAGGFAPVVMQIVFSQQVRKDPFVFFCLKKLHEVNQVFLLRDEGVFTAWLIDMIMVTGCHRNNVSCDPLGKFALKMQTSRLLISPCERKKYLSGL